MEKIKSPTRTWKVLFFVVACLAALFLTLYLETLKNSTRKSQEISLLRQGLNDYGRSFSQLLQDNKVVDEKVEPSKLLEKMSINFDSKLFEKFANQSHLGSKEHSSCEPEFVPLLNFGLIKPESKYPEHVLTIFDVSLHSTNQKIVDNFMTGVGAPANSELRDVVVMGKKYSFIADRFFEGFPTNDDGTCWAGGGYVENRFLLDEKLVVVVTTRDSERGCEGEPQVVTKSPDKETIEAVLRVIESIDY